MKISLTELKTYPKSKFDRLMKKLDDAYYDNDSALVTDAVYDKVEALYIKRFGKRTDVGSTKTSTKNRAKVDLPVPMSSLDKVRPGSKRLLSLDGKKVVMDKLDGISLLLEYVNGKLVHIYSKGKSGQGQLLDRHIPTLRLPKSIRGSALVRAEVVVPKAKFSKKYSTESGGEFNAIRNFVGTLSTSVESQPHFKDFDVVAYRAYGKGTLSAQLKWLQANGFNTVFHKSVTLGANAGTVLSKLLQSRGTNSPYEIDGIVVSDDADEKPRASNPKNSFAFKDNLIEDMFEVKVLRVEYQDSRMGKLTPVVYYTPVRHNGVTMQKATAHNGQYIIDNGIGPGAVIRVVRSGKVIPYIDDVVRKSRPQLPDVPYVQKGVFFYARARSNTAEIKTLTHFCITVGIEGAKDTSVAKLYAMGITTPKKLLSAKLDVLTLALGPAKAKAMYDRNTAIRKSGLDVVTLAVASNLFQGFGSTRISSINDSVADFYKLPAKTLLSKLKPLPGIDRTAPEFVRQTAQFSTWLADLGIKVAAKQKPRQIGTKLAGISVAFTGFRDKNLVDFIEKQGGTYDTSFKATTKLLVAKDGSSGSKLDKAAERGTTVMMLSQFMKKYGG